MSEMKLLVFTIQVQQTIVFDDEVEVTAANEEEACDRAIEQFECDWSKTGEIETTTHLIAVREP